MPATADRVSETTTTTGTGNVTLAGAATGYQSFNTAFGTNFRFWYCIQLAAEWEIGSGYLSAATTLVREVVYQSSNSDSLVNFSAGTKSVFCTQPAISVNSGSRGRAYASSRGMDMM